MKDGGSIMALRCLSSVEPGLLVRIGGRIDGVKYRGILQEKLLHSAKKKKNLGEKVTFQRDNGPKHTVKAMHEC